MKNLPARTGEGTAANSRKLWIDGLRAFAMLLVIVGHQEKIDVLYYLLNPVKVPLFFMVSGYVFNDKRTSVTEFIRKIMTGIVVPWMFMAVVSLLCYAPFNGGLKYFLNAFKNTLLGVSFWYIPCCIASMVLWFFTRKFFRKTAYTCIAAVVCFAAGLAAAHYQVLDEFMINRALICQLYMLLGFLFRKNEERISRIKWPYVAGCVVAYLAAAVLGMLVTPRPFIDVHLNIYDNMPYSFALIVLGGFALFAVAPRIRYIPKFLVFIGQNTLTFYMMHTFYIRLFHIVMKKAIGIDLSDSAYLLVINTVVAVLACTIQVLILDRIAPELLGKKRSSGKRRIEKAS